MKVTVFRVVSVILLLCVMIMIFSFSSQVAVESAETSMGLTYKIFCRFYPHFNELSFEKQQEIIASVQFPVRKLAHFSIFASLGFFSFMSLITYKSIKLYLRAILSFVISAVYSVSDEIHQLFVVGRSCEFRDMCIDSFGALVAILFVFTVVRFSKRLYSILK